MNFQNKSFLKLGNKKQSLDFYQKALDVKNKLKSNNKAYSIIAGDTIVYRAGTLFHKANSAEMVRNYLEILSSRKHFVYGGICIISNKGEVFKRLVTTEVYFEKLNKSGIQFPATINGSNHSMQSIFFTFSFLSFSFIHSISFLILFISLIA